MYSTCPGCGDFPDLHALICPDCIAAVQKYSSDPRFAGRLLTAPVLIEILRAKENENGS